MFTDFGCKTSQGYSVISLVKAFEKAFGRPVPYAAGRSGFVFCRSGGGFEPDRLASGVWNRADVRESLRPGRDSRANFCVWPRRCPFAYGKQTARHRAGDQIKKPQAQQARQPTWRRPPHTPAVSSEHQ